MLSTTLTRDFGLRYPILNASMAPAAVGNLARAVTQAGGLGMLGPSETWTPDDLRRECAAARGSASGRFGIGFGLQIERSPELFEAALAERPALICISFVDVAPYAERVRAAGSALGAQVQTRADSERALDAGVDLLIAQGTEAGGHTGDVSTLAMLQIALALADGTPVLAAGGIASPAGLAAVLAAGAEGAWIGTPFLLAHEANVPEAARERIIAAEETDTVLTSLFDRVQNIPWPARFRGRALQNEFTHAWHGNEDAAAADPAVRELFRAAQRSGRYEIANIYAGQSAGLLRERSSAAQIVRAIGEGAESLLRDRMARLLG
jgi:nitronate monooxygenase